MWRYFRLVPPRWAGRVPYATTTTPSATSSSSAAPPPPPPPTPAAPATVQVTVDGVAVDMAPGSSVIEACERAGVEIPRFCYHQRLAVAGNCRMCLVEVEKVPKPIASCAYPVANGMKVRTDTPMVKKAREGVMEFLLANHPLDCPICDQAGECDLQDQSMVYGADRSRLIGIGKRAVEDKNFGPLIKTSMNRCIHCTRCVRFANEVAGAEELGTTGRGNDMQIGTYVEQVLDSELSANIVDLCPVGALTSKPYAFTARPWELNKFESIDVLDAVGSNIRVDVRGLEVMRVLPRLNEDINEEWISDKTRFSYDGLKRQRLTTPLVRDGASFVEASWEDALAKVRSVMEMTPGESMAAVAGELTDVETMVVMKDLLSRFGCTNFFLDGPVVSAPIHGVDIRSNYLLNAGIANVERADALLLVGTNPRHEAAMVNARIRKGYLHFGLDLALIGPRHKLTAEYDHLGVGPDSLTALLGSSPKLPFAQRLKNAKRPLVVVGADVAHRDDAAAIFSTLATLAEQYNLVRPDWNGFAVLHRAAGKTGALDVGYGSAAKGQLDTAKLVFLLGADELPRSAIPKGSFVVYQGHHGDKHAQNADVILPGAAYTEKTATYVNTEGRAQQTLKAVAPPGNARPDWAILRALAEMTGQTLPYDTPEELSDRLAEIAPHLSQVDELSPVSAQLAKVGLAYLKEAGAGQKMSQKPFDTAIADFYLTNSISRASQTMAKCSATYTHTTSREERLALNE